MPFMIVHSEKGYCVHTQDEDGDPKGDPHGCHPTKAEAVQQMRALYANVPEARKATLDTAGSQMTEYDRPLTHVVKQRGDEFCVFAPGEAEPKRCFPTEEAAQSYAASCGTKADLRDAWDQAFPREADFLVGFGGAAIKALPEGRLRGRLVHYTGPDDYDITAEFFDAATDFGTALPAKLGLYYQHGFDPTIGRRRLGHAEVKAEDDGLWFETQLDLADRYQARIYQLAQAGRLGASSGAVKHLVQKEPAGKAARITSWPLGEVSLTPSPAMPSCGVLAAKAWLDQAPSFADLVADLPASKASFGECLERWLEEGEPLAQRLQQFAAADAAKAGRPQFSASRVERAQRMYLLLKDILTEVGAMPADGEGEQQAPEMGAATGGTGAEAPFDGPALEGQFLATLARLNGVGVEAAAPVAG
jgi:HK97 family phage prohead protease